MSTAALGWLLLTAQAGTLSGLGVVCPHRLEMARLTIRAYEHQKEGKIEGVLRDLQEAQSIDLSATGCERELVARASILIRAGSYNLALAELRQAASATTARFLDRLLAADGALTLITGGIPAENQGFRQIGGRPPEFETNPHLLLPWDRAAQVHAQFFLGVMRQLASADTRSTEVEAELVREARDSYSAHKAQVAILHGRPCEAVPIAAGLGVSVANYRKLKQACRRAESRRRPGPRLE